MLSRLLIKGPGRPHPRLVFVKYAAVECTKNEDVTLCDTQINLYQCIICIPRWRITPNFYEGIKHPLNRYQRSFNVHTTSPPASLLLTWTVASSPLPSQHFASHSSNDVLSALNEVSDHGLTGALSALHEFMASGGDPAVLEKAYDLARSVAGSKNDVKVAFDACRIALAAG